MSQEEQKPGKHKREFERLWSDIQSQSGTSKPEANKIPSTEVGRLLSEVAAQRHEKVREDFKVAIAAIYDAKIQMDRDIKKKLQEFEKFSEEQYLILSNKLKDAYKALEQSAKEKDEYTRGIEGSNDEKEQQSSK